MSDSFTLDVGPSLEKPLFVGARPSFVYSFKGFAESADNALVTAIAAEVVKEPSADAATLSGEVTDDGAIKFYLSSTEPGDVFVKLVATCDTDLIVTAVLKIPFTAVPEQA